MDHRNVQNFKFAKRPLHFFAQSTAAAVCALPTAASVAVVSWASARLYRPVIADRGVLLQVAGASRQQAAQFDQPSASLSPRGDGFVFAVDPPQL